MKLLDPKLYHPSGVLWERVNWPFQTEEERKLICAYRRKQHRKDKKELPKLIGEALL